MPAKRLKLGALSHLGLMGCTSPLDCQSELGFLVQAG